MLRLPTNQITTKYNRCFAAHNMLDTKKDGTTQHSCHFLIAFPSHYHIKMYLKRAVMHYLVNISSGVLVYIHLYQTNKHKHCCFLAGATVLVAS